MFKNLVFSYITGALKVVSLVLVASCTVVPKELTKIELEDSAKLDKALMFGTKEKLSFRITDTKKTNEFAG